MENKENENKDELSNGKGDKDNKPKIEIIPFEIDQDVKMIDLKPIEKKRLDAVFSELTKLEQEPSSDEDSLTKKYLKEVERNAELKKMNKNFFKNEKYDQLKDKEMKEQKQKEKKRNKSNSLLSDKKTYGEDNNSVQEDNAKKNAKTEIKLSQKALRKMLRFYTTKKYSPEEIEQMIWEVDEDMDGKVSKYEMEKMYKRCITDKEELEPKKLFYFILFLMFDKENKRSITEEDTLELLRVRHRSDKEFNEAIDEIFNPEHKPKHKAGDEEERLNYDQFLNVMTNLVLTKRDLVRDKRENYCNHIKDEIEKDKRMKK